MSTMPQTKGQMNKQPIVPKQETAFPISYESENASVTVLGMTLRDYFAGHAVGALLQDDKANFTELGAARMAYHVADAMLKARSE